MMIIYVKMRYQKGMILTTNELILIECQSLSLSWLFLALQLNTMRNNESIFTREVIDYRWDVFRGGGGLSEGF